MKSINSFLRNIRFRKRQKYYQRIVKNVDSTVSLISSNCWGGFLYHDMGLQFLTPTINLTFDPDDYLFFCENLGSLKTAILTEDKSNEHGYIVGILFYPDLKKQIKVHFVHYKTFQEAKDVFQRRSMRINFNNYIFLFNIFHLKKEIADRFRCIPGRKICVYVHRDAECDTSSDNNCLFFRLNCKIPPNKDMLSFKTPLGRKMYIDNIKFSFHKYIFSKTNSK